MARDLRGDAAESVRLRCFGARKFGERRVVEGREIAEPAGAERTVRRAGAPFTARAHRSPPGRSVHRPGRIDLTQTAAIRRGRSSLRQFDAVVSRSVCGGGGMALRKHGVPEASRFGGMALRKHGAAGRGVPCAPGRRYTCCA
ncbi:hypothetical protein GCM10027033_01120 [Leucobacter ruminantium]|uniref:Uncharacterized protein n=1 Tax=Leucobacter ruminantium TaxID=1289170 RepID=A0A939LYE3_9MICO|nr:hypothetical protein [Leucobacter ruminantium]